MNNYIQKITSRSPQQNTGDNSTGGLMMPDKFPMSKDETEFEPEVTNNALPLIYPIQIDSRIQNTEGLKNSSPNDEIQPIHQAGSEINFIENRVEKTVSVQNDEIPIASKAIIRQGSENTSPKSETNQLQPTPGVIEKLIHRTVYQKMTENEPSQIIITPPASDVRKNDTPLTLEKTDDRTEKKVQDDFRHEPDSTVIKYQPDTSSIIPSKKEMLFPVQKDNVFSMPVRKKEETAKLIIGKITVEVVNPIQAVKPKEIVRQKADQGSAATTEFTHINKLSFGLSQF